MKSGDLVYLAHPGEVESVLILGFYNDRNLKNPIEDPVTVLSMNAEESEPWPVPRASLTSDPLAAAIRAEELEREWRNQFTDN